MKWRHFLLGKIAMTNLDSILKSRDITLPTKLHIVQAMVLPVAMFGSESLTIKKAESKNWCFWIVMLEKTLESPLDFKEIKPVNSKGNQPEYSLEGLMLKLKLQYFGHLMLRANLLEKTWCWGKIVSKRRREWQRMRWLDSIIDSMDMNLSKHQEIVEDRGDWHAAVHRVAKSRTWFSDWTTTVGDSHIYESLRTT